MKKIFKIILSSILVVFLLAGCGKQVNITDTFSSTDKTQSTLDKLLAYEANAASDSVDLSLFKVEIVNTNSFSGKAAIVYSRTYNTELTDLEAKNIYINKEQKSNLNNVKKSYKEVVKDYDSNIKDLPEGILNGVADVNEITEDMNGYIASVAQVNHSIDTLVEDLQVFGDRIDAVVTALEAKIPDYINDDPDVQSTVESLESVRNITIQDIINKQNKLKEKIIKQAKKQLQASTLVKIEKDYKSMLKDNKNVKFSKVDYNDNEVFAIIKYDNITDLHPNILISTPNNLVESEFADDSLVRDISRTRLKYALNNMKSPTLRAMKEIGDEIQEQVVLLDIIKLEQDGKKITQESTKKFTEYLRNYSEDINKIVTKYNGIIYETPLEEVKNNIDSIIEEALIELEALNAKYDEFASAEVVTLEENLRIYRDKPGKFIDDTEAVDFMLDILNEYDNNLKAFTDENIGFEKITEAFNDTTMAYLQFNNPITIEMRFTIDGKYINKLTYNDKIDSKDNYHLNAQESGDVTVRINPNSNEALMLMKINSFSISYIKYIALGIFALLVLLFFVNKNVFKKMLTVLILLTIAFVVIYPMAWIIGSSFNKTQSLGQVGISPFPKEASLVQYKRLFLHENYNYGSWYLNTFKIAFFNMIICVLLTVSTAYVFSRFKFKGKKSGMMFMLIIQIFPSFSSMVAIYTLLSAITFLKPLTGTQSLIDTHLGLLLVYSAGQVPYNTWLVKGYFDSIPRSLDEAAKIDGASNLQAFWKVILPLGIPIVSFVAVTSFMSPWMDFILPTLLLKSPKKKTLAIGLQEMISGQSNNNFTLFAAGSVLVAVPITALFAFCQKYVVTGLSSGAVKG